jgi:hypothetical protein
MPSSWTDCHGLFIVCSAYCNTKVRFRRRTSHVPNLIDDLGTAEERRMNQLSTAEFGAAKVRQSLSHYATLERH